MDLPSSGGNTTILMWDPDHAKYCSPNLTKPFIVDYAYWITVYRLSLNVSGYWFFLVWFFNFVCLSVLLFQFWHFAFVFPLMIIAFQFRLFNKDSLMDSQQATSGSLLHWHFEETAISSSPNNIYLYCLLIEIVFVTDFYIEVPVTVFLHGQAKHSLGLYI